MTIVPTAELANQLPHILEALAAGEEVVLTQSGQAVARIVPPVASAGQGLAAAQRRQEFDAWMKLVEDGAER